MKNPITKPEKIRIATTSIACLLNASFIPARFDSFYHSLIGLLVMFGVSFYLRREARVGDCRTGSIIDAVH